jgi:3-isopropylmalate/(R)-2-methylmalate dehydratase small subunit
VLIAPSFADIFISNCVKVGLLPIVLPEPQVKSLMAAVDRTTGSELTVDLEAQTIASSDGTVVSFDFDPFQRHCLLNGLDDIGRALLHEADITAYEAARPARVNTLALS